jgi:hypothetical protein
VGALSKENWQNPHPVKQSLPASLAEVILLSMENSIFLSGLEKGNSLKQVDHLETAGFKLGFIPQLIKGKQSGTGSIYNRNMDVIP